MKKRVIIISIIVIVLVLCSFFVIYKSMASTKKENLVDDIYNKMKENGQYSFLMKNSENKFETTIAQKDTKTMIDMYSNGTHTTTLIKDGATYFIMHDSEEYYYYDSDEVETGILLDELYGLQGKNYETGKEKINGTKYKYEQYNGFSGFITSTSKDMKEEDINTRFYFDKNNKLVYIKTITNESEELLKIELSFEVDDSIFEIPSNYAEK